MRPGIHWPRTLAILAALSVVQTAVFDQIWFGGVVRVDLLLLTVVALGLHADPRSATLLGFVVGLFVDVLRFGPFGLHALVFCLGCWALANNQTKLLQVGTGFRVAQATVAVLLVTAATWTAAAVFGQRPPPFGNASLVSIGVTAVVGGVLVVWPFGPIARSLVDDQPARRTPRADLVRVES